MHDPLRLRLPPHRHYGCHAGIRRRVADLRRLGHIQGAAIEMPRTMSPSVSPGAPKGTDVWSPDSRAGRSGRSTSMRIDVDTSCSDDVVKPDTERAHTLQEASGRMVTEKRAGADLAVSITIWSSPASNRPENATPAGDVTFTESVSPGLTTLPEAGETIASAGGVCARQR
jgi:hypothetical protein